MEFNENRFASLANDVDIDEEISDNYVIPKLFDINIIIKDVNNILTIYKLVSGFHPNWLQDKFNSNTYTNIIGYIVTHRIDEKYNIVPEYHNNINSIFYKALCHILSIVNMDKNNVLYTYFVNMFTVFCVLSRPMTYEEFVIVHGCKYNSEENNMKLKTLYNMYSIIDNMNMFEPDDIYLKLCNSFCKKKIQINEIINYNKRTPVKEEHITIYKTKKVNNIKKQTSTSKKEYDIFPNKKKYGFHDKKKRRSDADMSRNWRSRE